MTSSFSTLMEAAVDATRASQPATALRLLADAARLEPSSALPHFLVAALHAGAGLADSAEAAYIACLSRSPDFAMARFQLGLLQLTAGRQASAQATWEPLLRLSDAHYLKCFVQGLIALTADRAFDAERWIRNGIALNAENSALNQDMQGVLARHESLGGAQEAAAQPGSAKSGRAHASTAAHHFLVSSYGQETDA